VFLEHGITWIEANIFPIRYILCVLTIHSRKFKIDLSTKLLSIYKFLRICVTG
jgi:hypothetical protein